MRAPSPRPIAALALALASLLAGCSGGGGGGGGSSSSAAAVAIVPTGAPAVVVSDGAGGALVSPFPDDRLTVADATSPTGKRLAVPLRTDTARFAGIAAEIAKLDGFGVRAPIEVGFDDDLDPATIRDDTVVVVNVGRSARRGERAALDLGRGSYPTSVNGPTSFYARDPLAGSGDIVAPPGGLAQYEAASRTLVLRPLAPLEEGARHVVLLLDGLRGANGAPVSPPGTAAFMRDTGDDDAIGRALAAVGASPASIRYQWAFTTGTPTRELRALADGLGGSGPFAAALAAEPPKLERIDRLDLGGVSPYVLDAAILGPLFQAIRDVAAPATTTSWEARQLVEALAIVDLRAASYVAFGSIAGPDLRTSARATFDVDLASGRASVAKGRTTFMLIVPTPCAANGYAKPPYPVLLCGHGEARSRVDGLALAGIATRHGWALAAFDAVDHGPDDALAHLPRLVQQSVQGAQNIATAKGLIATLGVVLGAPPTPTASLEDQLKTVLWKGKLAPLFHDGRATDVDGDGYTDSGALYFTADVFRTRDIVRQTMIDIMSLERVLAGFGVDRNGNGKLDPEEGDLDGDGICDVGGPGARFAYTGISLGGIIGAALVGADPQIERADLMSPGAGFTDIVTTSDLRGVTSRVMHEMFSDVVLGKPAGAGKASVSVDGAGGGFGSIATAPSGTATVRNARTGASATAAVASDGGFRVHIACDKGDPLALVTRDAQGVTLGAVQFAAPLDGMGFERCTPAFRAFLGLAALGVEASDPAAYAPLWRTPPAGRAKKDVLIQGSLGDTTVPTFTGAALGRAAGLISAARNDLLISRGVLDGGLANVDRDSGVEATSGAGIRFLGVNDHAGLLFPASSDVAGAQAYAADGQEQALEFIDAGAIDDAFAEFDTVLP
jgi:hypothetical protein